MNSVTVKSSHFPILFCTCILTELSPGWCPSSQSGRNVLFLATLCLKPRCGGRNEEWQACGMEMRCSVSSLESALFHPPTPPRHRNCCLLGPLGKDLPCNSSTADGHLSSVFRLSCLPDSSACDLNSLGSWGMDSGNPIKSCVLAADSNKILGKMSRRVMTILHSWNCMAE